MTRRFVAPGNWAHILRVERTLEFRKDSGFWALPNTLLPPPPPAVLQGASWGLRQRRIWRGSGPSMKVNPSMRVGRP